MGCGANSANIKSATKIVKTIETETKPKQAIEQTTIVISPTTVPDVKEEVEKSFADADILTLVSDLFAAITAGEISKKDGILHQIQQIDFSKAVQISNPINLFNQILTGMSDDSFLYQETWVKQIMAHTASHVVYRVYIKNKQEKQALLEETRTKWTESVEKMVKLIGNKTNQTNGLRYELEVLLAGIKVFSITASEVKDKVLDFVKQVIQAATSAVSGDFSGLKDLGLNTLLNLFSFAVKKADEYWFLKVLAISYTNSLAIQNKDMFEQVLQIIEKNQLGDWHVLYAGIELMSQVIKAGMTLVPLWQLLQKLSDHSDWRIREKVADVCIFHSDHKDQNVRNQLAVIYSRMLLGETDKNVLSTLKDEKNIKKTKSMMQKSWQKIEADKQQEAQDKQDEITKLENLIKETSKTDKEGLMKLQMDLQTQIESQQAFTKQLSNFASTFDMKFNFVDEINKKLDKQDETLQIMLQLMRQNEGRNPKEIKDELMQKQTQMADQWTQSKSVVVKQKCVTDLRLIEDSKKSVKADENVMDFIDNQDAKVLLVHGGAGSGKTQFVQQIMQQLIESKPDLIPIFVSLPKLKDKLTGVVKESLEKYCNITEKELNNFRKMKYKLVIIIDGYDEINDMRNIYDSNNFGDWNCKLIITCRTNFLATNPTYWDLFLPENYQKSMFQEAILLPFNKKQIQEYITSYIELHKNDQNFSGWLESEKYTEQFSKFPGISDLIATPFMLGMFVEVLPSLTQESNKNLYISDLYKKFIDNWFLRQKAKEEKEYSQSGKKSRSAIVDAYTKYSMDFAIELYKQDQNFEEYDPDDPVFFKFLNPDDPVATANRNGSPIKQQDNCYSFIQNTVHEYFICIAIQQQVKKLNEPKLQNYYYDYLINVKQITKTSILEFLAEFMEKDETFEKLLFNIVMLSKIDKKITVAASNAISILNFAQKQFIGKDFSNVSIAKADLSHAILDSANFSGAQLQDVDFKQAWLQNANLQSADLTGSDFGQNQKVEYKFIGYENYEFDFDKLRLAPSEQQVAVVGQKDKDSQQQVFISDFINTTKVFELPIGADVQNLKFNKQETKIAATFTTTTNETKTQGFRIWDLTSGNIVLDKEPTIHEQSLHDISFSKINDAFIYIVGNQAYFYDSNYQVDEKFFDQTLEFNMSFFVFNEETKKIFLACQMPKQPVENDKDDIEEDYYKLITYNKQGQKYVNECSFEIYGQIQVQGDQLLQINNSGIYVWNLYNHELINSKMENLKAEERRISSSTNKTQFVVELQNKETSIRVFNTKSLKQIQVISDCESEKTIYCNKFAQLMVVEDSKLYGIKMQPVNMESDVHVDSVWKVGFQQGTNNLYTTSSDITINWDLLTGKVVKSLKQTVDTTSPDFKCVLSIGTDLFQIFSFDDKKLISKFKTDPKADYKVVDSFFDEKQNLFCTVINSQTRKYQAITYNQQENKWQIHCFGGDRHKIDKDAYDYYQEYVIVKRSKQYLLICEYQYDLHQSMIKLIDLQKLQEVGEFHNAAVYCVMISPDELSFVVASSDHIHIYNTQNISQISKFKIKNCRQVQYCDQNSNIIMCMQIIKEVDKTDKPTEEKPQEKIDTEEKDGNEEEEEDENESDDEDDEDDISKLTNIYKIDVSKKEMQQIKINLPNEYFSEVISVCDMDSFQYNNQLTKIIGIPHYGNRGCYLFDLVMNKINFIHSCSIITAATFSPNSKQIVIGNANGSIQVYDTDSLKLLWSSWNNELNFYGVKLDKAKYDDKIKDLIVNIKEIDQKMVVSTSPLNEYLSQEVSIYQCSELDIDDGEEESDDESDYCESSDDESDDSDD